MPTHPLAPYDALVVLSFGGPEAPDEVMPFLRRVTAGRGIPDDRLTEVAEHYLLFGGVSPINAQNRALVAALAAELQARHASVPVHLANRNTQPFAEEVLAGLTPGRILVILTSGLRSYSSCRQYREDLARAADAGLIVDKIASYAEHPAVLDATTHLTATALAPILADDPAGHVLTVAHSLPLQMDASSGPAQEGGHAYSAALARVSAHLHSRLSERFGRPVPVDLTYCSRSGPPRVPWLGPGVGERLEQLADAGVTTVLLAPIGFVSDHMEVRYDLDTEARAQAEALGIRLERAPTLGIDPRFVSALADLAFARAAEARGESSSVPQCPPPTCPADCCPNPRGELATRCAADVAA
ncbi:MAG: ferrochelatase [Tetrasphaera sp.]